jgi:hypothetical protein
MAEPSPFLPPTAREPATGTADVPVPIDRDADEAV